MKVLALLLWVGTAGASSAVDPTVVAGAGEFAPALPGGVLDLWTVWLRPDDLCPQLRGPGDTGRVRTLERIDCPYVGAIGVWCRHRLEDDLPAGRYRLVLPCASRETGAGLGDPPFEIDVWVDAPGTSGPPPTVRREFVTLSIDRDDTGGDGVEPWQLNAGWRAGRPLRPGWRLAASSPAGFGGDALSLYATRSLDQALGKATAAADASVDPGEELCVEVRLYGPMGEVIPIDRTCAETPPATEVGDCGTGWGAVLLLPLLGLGRRRA